MKAKLDRDFRNYRILGACNPQLAFRALSVEDKIGVEDGRIDVAAIDPQAPMEGVGNAALSEIAAVAREKLERVVGNF
jgi:uncharacterized protein (DUF302 family)